MKALFRLIKIAWVITRFRLDTLIPVHHLPFSLRVLLTLMFLRHLFPVNQPVGMRVRLALEALGPVFIKFGQMLSTRRDLLPEELASELSKLQDQVPAFEGKLARTVIETQLKGSIETHFASFDEQPLASASVAQVHPATLLTGEDVVVKVIRPGIRNTIENDLALMFIIAKLVQLIPDGKRLRPVEVVDEYRKTILDELDLMREGANAATLRRNFEGSDQLYVPEVYWELTRPQILVMERIYGIPVSDVDALNAQGTNMKKLAERGVEIFFTQVFRDSFFHADMHPGNVFVSRDNPQDPSYIGLDCGIVGTLSEQDQSYLAQNLLAFFNRDYHQVAKLHVESGWVSSDTKVQEFESAIRSVCEPVFEKPLAEISFGLVLVRLFQTARRFNMEVQPQLVLLQKTLLNIEGLGRDLYPELNLWDTAKPFLENWLKDRLNPLKTLKSLWQHTPAWLEKAPQVPDLVFNTLQQAGDWSQSSQQIQVKLQELETSLEKQKTQRLWQWVANVALLASIWTYFDFWPEVKEPTYMALSVMVVSIVLAFKK